VSQQPGAFNNHEGESFEEQEPGIFPDATIETMSELSQNNTDSVMVFPSTERKDARNQNEEKVFPSHVNKPSYLLQTAEAFAHHNNETKVKIRLLLDSGSQRTYVSTKIVRKLNLKPSSTENLHVSTFANPNSVMKKCEVFDLNIFPVSSNENITLKAVAMNHLYNPITGQDITWAVNHHDHLKDLNLADKGSGTLSVDILVGNDHYWDITNGEVKHSKFSPSGPVAMNSKLGWILSGPTHGTKSYEHQSSSHNES